MLRPLSKLKGHAIEATDGRIGTVSDVLFDDASWKTRWLVIDTGRWLPGRKVLIHPSAISGVDDERQRVSVTLTKARIEGSPDIMQDQPVSRRREAALYGYYGSDPNWGGSYFGMGAVIAPFSSRPYFDGFGAGETAAIHADDADQDPHLRSVVEVDGYRIQASDGEIGHVQDLLVDDAGWGIRYLIVDTRNWWPGQHVLVAPFVVREINWGDRQIRLTITREKIKASPPWNPPHDTVDESYANRLHEHYGWPGYGA
jgi:sporulation protein YlmC with PRC-barrel domain